MYKSGVAICDGILRLGIDHVYVRSRLGDQSTITQLLNQNIGQIQTLTTDHSDTCVRQVFRALCRYYLPPCGNSTHPTPPSSICQEECQLVQDKCQPTWDAVLPVFENIDPTIDCNDTSRLLFPVPHCCTGAGLGISLSNLSVYLSVCLLITAHSSGILGNLQDDETSQQKDGARVAWIAGGVSFFIVLAAVMVVGAIVLVWVLPKIRKMKRIEEVQLDILARLVSLCLGGDSFVYRIAEIRVCGRTQIHT